MSPTTCLALLGTLFLLPSAVLAAGDPHDKLVYGRYGRQLAPSVIKFDPDMKFAELGRPATRADVAGGKAIFTLEGLGKTRVYRLPDRCPVTAFWWTTSPARTGDTSGHTPAKDKKAQRKSAAADGRRELEGLVCQAEELEVDGVWKRYYGFLCEEGAAVVPARDVELYNTDGPVVQFESTQVPHVQWGLMVPRWVPGSGKTKEELAPRLGDPVPLSLHFSSGRKEPVTVPALWHKDARGGGALREGLRISLLRAPFEPKRPDAGTRTDSEFAPVARKHDAHFAAEVGARRLESFESFQALTLDLRDWFQVEKEGYYKVHCELDAVAAGLAENAAAIDELAACFTIGIPPQQPTIAQFNARMPPFGSVEAEQRLLRVIRETASPQPVELKALPADVEALLAWSQPVNGLIARIDNVWAKRVVLVRLKNLSAHPLLVPTGNLYDEKQTALFTVHVQHGTGPWRLLPNNARDDRYVPPPSDPGRDLRSRKVFRARGTRRPADRPWVTLQPGADCVALVATSPEPDTGERQTVKVVLRQPDIGLRQRWSGVLQTPPLPLERSPAQYEALIGRLAFPSDFPALSHDRSSIGSESGSETSVYYYFRHNQPLIDTLRLYDPDGVRAEFQRRLLAEKSFPMRLLQATVAAAAGSAAAATFLLESAKDTDVGITAEMRDALRFMSWNYSATPPHGKKRAAPGWFLELCLAILSDDRCITGLEKGAWKLDWEEGTAFRISSWETERLIAVLAEQRSERALSFLLQRIKSGRADDRTRLAFCAFRDVRMIPILTEWVRTERLADDLLEATVQALADLKARDAVPVLLERLEVPCFIAALEAIGDPRALPALRQIVADKGQVLRKGKPVRPEQAARRLYTAKVALAHLDAANETDHLLQLLADANLQESNRHDLLRRLAQRRDPRAIPCFLSVIKKASDYYSIATAINGLSELKCKASIEGLIECFDVPFQEEGVFKRHVTPADYRNELACALRDLTGQSFGVDKQRWLRWWHETGRHSTDLK